MCKTKITAGTLKKVAKVEWNQDTNMAVLTYDASKTSQDEILKRIALVGYDSDKFLPDATYDALHECCQYEREEVARSSQNGTATMKIIPITENHSITLILY
jgi:hypothetical protein